MSNVFAPFTLPLRREGDASIVDANGRTVLVVDPERDIDDDKPVEAIADHVFARIIDHPAALVNTPDAAAVCATIAPYLGATDKNDWSGLLDDDAISMTVKMRIGDLRALKAIACAAHAGAAS